MAPQLVLFVFILTPGLAEPTLTSFERAAREVLGAKAELHLETLTEPLSDDQAIEKAKDALGVAKLVWSDDRQQVLLHCYLAEQRRWVDRTVSFTSSDQDAERGRWLGFAVASMFTSAGAPATPRDEAQKPKRRERPKPASPAEVRREGSPAPDAQPRVAPSSGLTRSLEFAGVATTGIGGTAETLGANAALRLGVGGPFWLRVGISARTGDIAAAQASSKTALFSLGSGISLLGPDSKLDLGMRADLLAGWFGVSHLSEDDIVADHASRELFAADGLALAGYRFAPAAAAFLAMGLEATFGMTDIYAHGQHVATVPVLRGLGELGFRTDF